MDELKEVEARKIATTELEAMTLRDAEERAAEVARLQQIEADKEQTRLHAEEAERKKALKKAADDNEQRRLAEVVAAEKALKEQQRAEEAVARQEAAAAEATREQDERQRRLEAAEAEAAALAAAEDEATAEKRRRAEAAKKKRDAFLSDVNAFSQSVEGAAADANRGESNSDPLALTGQLNQLNQQYKAPASASLFADTNVFEPPAAAAPDPVAVVPPTAPIERDASVRIGAGTSFDELTSSLFAANSSALAAAASAAASAGAEAPPAAAAAPRGDPFDAHDALPSAAHGPAAGPYGAPAAGGLGDEGDEDLEDEGTGGDRSISNILTRVRRVRAMWTRLGHPYTLFLTPPSPPRCAMHDGWTHLGGPYTCISPT